MGQLYSENQAGTNRQLRVGLPVPDIKVVELNSKNNSFVIQHQNEVNDLEKEYKGLED
jgi:hypothetical protein